MLYAWNVSPTFLRECVSSLAKIRLGLRFTIELARRTASNNAKRLTYICARALLGSVRLLSISMITLLGI